MAILCLGALLAGFGAALALPFLPFACALVVAVLIGSVSLVATGGSLPQTGLSALAVLVLGQIGYGLGLAATALVTALLAAAHRPAAAEPASRPVQPLRTGNEPR